MDFCIVKNATVKQTIEKMQDRKIPAIAVVDDNGIFKGLFTNGDMRRYFLDGGDLGISIECAMNEAPTVFASLTEVNRFRESRSLIAYPIVSSNGLFLDMIFDDEIDHGKHELEGVPLVVMAGGKGTRLYPYTKILPKALVPLGDKTISEHIIAQFTKYGCNEVHFVLKHKADMIRAYFNELDREYDVSFVEEDVFLGTGGGLYLLKDKLSGTFIMSNCDIIINDDLLCAYRTHKERCNTITFVCAMMNVSIPYGVIEANAHGEVVAMKEKPSLSYLVNTGVYVVEPEIFDYFSDREFIHFPNLASRVMENGGRVGIFPVPEKAWVDIGELAKMNKALGLLGLEK